MSINHTHRWLGCFVCSLLALLTPVAAAQQPAAKNVLFMISDDLNTVLGCYGATGIHTPNIDRLAKRAVLFRHAYCAFPLCGPSRNAMLTGLYPNSTGIHANSLIFRQTIPAQISLPQAFRQQGWLAGRIGKLYHYNVPNSIGTDGHDDPASWELELNPAGVDRTKEHPLITSLVPNQFGGMLSWHASQHPDEQHTDALLASDADWVLERCAKRRERPFFLSVGFFRPHTPYVAPQSWFDQYPADRMPVVTGLEADLQDIPEAALESQVKAQLSMTDLQKRQARQAYQACISFMDAQVGKVLDALDRHGLTDSTVIVFTSDHGYHLGEHSLWQKRSLFEESARVPLLIAAPGCQQGQVCNSPVSHVDLYPTLTELCGVKTPSGLQGQSLVPMLRDVTQAGRNWALTQVQRGNAGTNADGKQARPDTRYFGYSLRTPRWRYTEWDDGSKGRELYDHDNDPRELTNLADQQQHSETAAELSALLKTAVAGTLPADGKIPAVQQGLWAPVLLDP